MDFSDFPLDSWSLDDHDPIDLDSWSLDDHGPVDLDSSRLDDHGVIDVAMSTELANLKVNYTLYSTKHQWLQQLQHLAISQGNVLQQFRMLQQLQHLAISQGNVFRQFPSNNGLKGIVNSRDSSSNLNVVERVTFEKGSLTPCTALDLVDVLENIFLCSCVKDIPKFKRVCRLWKDILESERFLAQQVQRALPLELTEEHVTPDYIGVGTYNGLVLERKRNHSDHYFRITNPATGFILNLPTLLGLPSLGQIVINNNMSAILVHGAFATVKLHFVLKIGANEDWNQVSNLQFSLRSDIMCGYEFHSWTESSTTVDIWSLNLEETPAKPHQSTFDISKRAQNRFQMIWRGLFALCFIEGSVLQAYVLAKVSGSYVWTEEEMIVLPPNLQAENLKPIEAIGNQICFQLDPITGIVYDIDTGSIEGCQIFRRKYIPTSRKLVF